MAPVPPPRPIEDFNIEREEGDNSAAWQYIEDLAASGKATSYFSYLEPFVGTRGTDSWNAFSLRIRESDPIALDLLWACTSLPLNTFQILAGETAPLTGNAPPLPMPLDEIIRSCWEDAAPGPNPPFLRHLAVRQVAHDGAIDAIESEFDAIMSEGRLHPTGRQMEVEADSPYWKDHPYIKIAERIAEISRGSVRPYLRRDLVDEEKDDDGDVHMFIDLDEPVDLAEVDRRRGEAALQAEADRLAEAQRLAEAARLAEEQRKTEAQRRAEAARLAEEQRQAEADRVAEEQRLAEAARLAEEKRLAEAAQKALEEGIMEEVSRIEAERLKAQRLKEEADRLEAERIAAAHIAAMRAEAQRLQEEADREEAERIEAKRLKDEADRLEAERIAAKRAEAQRLKDELAREDADIAKRLEEGTIQQKELLEQQKQRLEAERLEAERLEAKRLKDEADRIEAERLKLEGETKTPEELAEEQRQAARKAQKEAEEAEDKQFEDITQAAVMKARREEAAERARADLLTVEGRRREDERSQRVHQQALANVQQLGAQFRTEAMAATRLVIVAMNNRLDSAAGTAARTAQRLSWRTMRAMQDTASEEDRRLERKRWKDPGFTGEDESRIQRDRKAIQLAFKEQEQMNDKAQLERQAAIEKAKQDKLEKDKERIRAEMEQNSDFGKPKDPILMATLKKALARASELEPSIREMRRTVSDLSPDSAERIRYNATVAEHSQCVAEVERLAKHLKLL